MRHVFPESNTLPRGVVIHDGHLCCGRPQRVSEFVVPIEQLGNLNPVIRLTAIYDLIHTGFTQ